MDETFVIVTRTLAPLDRLFEVSLDIDEHVASMSGSDEQAIAGVTSGSIGLGETVAWRARHFGVRFTLASKITELEHDRRFVDEQVRGPFRTYRHERDFRREGDVTVMVDTVTVGSPVFGAIVDPLILAPYLRRLIRRRNAHLLRSVGHTPTTAPDAAQWPDVARSEFRRAEASAVIGRGDEDFTRVAETVMTWGVKTRSGFSVSDARDVEAGRRLVVTARAAGVTVREPVEVVTVIRTPARVGFSYRTLPGHPVRGEEAFIVHRDGDDVVLTVRSLTAPSDVARWRCVYPALLVVQRFVRRRYLRALRGKD